MIGRYNQQRIAASFHPFQNLGYALGQTLAECRV
jgi:hypothetical protein